MIDSSSASARDRSSVVRVDGLAFNPRTRSSISSMSARRTRFALRSPACSGVEMTSSPMTVVYRGRRREDPPTLNIPRLRPPASRENPTVGGYASGALSRAQPSAARTARCHPPYAALASDAPAPGWITETRCAARNSLALDQTPVWSPARPARAQRRGLDHRGALDRHAEHVGLILHQPGIVGGPAVHPQGVQPHPAPRLHRLHHIRRAERHRLQRRPDDVRPGGPRG